MSDPTVVAAYFKAWNDHDLKAIMDTFNAGGTYTDPATGGALEGDAIAQYAESLYAAFPDLYLELVCEQQSRNGMWVAPWVLTGTTTEGKAVELLGCDFITVSDNKIDTVYGVFNPAQLG